MNSKSDPPKVDQAAFQKSLGEFVEFREALTKESDRGCALFAAAFLDHALKELVTKCLVQDEKIKDELLGQNGPLASFSSRINLAYYLGKLSRVCRRDLNTIRQIRNEFAHKSTLITFDTPSVADRCRTLLYSAHERAERPRAHFTSSTCAILANLHATTRYVTPAVVREDDAPTEARKAEHRETMKAFTKQLPGGKATPNPEKNEPGES